MTRIGLSAKSVLVIFLVVLEIIVVSAAANGIDVFGSTIGENQAQYHFPVAQKSAVITAKIGKGLYPMPAEATSFKAQIKPTIDYFNKLDTVVLFDPMSVWYNTTRADQLVSKRSKLEDEIVVLTKWQDLLAKTLSSAADESDYIEVRTQISELVDEVSYPGDDKCLYHCFITYYPYR